MTREDVLKEAQRCVCGERDLQYGNPESNFSAIARLWSEYLSRVNGNSLLIEPSDVAAMMVLLKVARIASGNGKADNWIDIAGYAACGGEIESN